MRHLTRLFQRIRDEEQGHALVGVASLVAAIGAIVLAIGAAAGDDTTTIVGGVVLGVAIFLSGVARHRGIDYEMYTRLDQLEKKDAGPTG
jgi:hypothetical protein